MIKMADSLAVKYRPKTFEDVTEQELVVKVLKSMCEQPEITCRNFLFIGSQGTGKTTLARIVSNVLNNNEGEPIEIDSASHGNVESIRDIVNQARQYPVGQKYKIFILDECHCISPAGWSAFLKVIEEVPAKTIFMFATTNPEKIPATIISRVQTFQLSKISLDGITNRLKYVLDQENLDGKNIIYDDSSINYIAKMANGGMRDALTLLDKVLAYSTIINAEHVSKALNLPEYNDFFKLLSSYAKKDNKTIAEIIDKVYNSGVNFVKWFENFHSFTINIVKYILLQDINRTIIPSTYQSQISKYNEKHMTICLKLANKLVKLNYELKSTQYLQELALTYLCSVPSKKEDK